MLPWVGIDVKVMWLLSSWLL